MIAFLALTLASTDLFVSGEGGYHTYRIPALIESKRGTLLAFCEGRRGSAGDAGDIDLLLRRSFDQGRTWQPVQLVADFGGDTIGNPAPVVDRATGAILLLLTSNGGTISERMIEEGKGERRVWIARSTDDGATWTKPEEITAQVKRPDWTWYATGPGNGIQVKRSGRLVIACDHTRLGSKARHSHLIYSDDHGATWKIGGIAEEKTNESAVAELPNGELLLNMRSYHGRGRRAVQRSRDGGVTLEKPLTFDEVLVDPVCQASLISMGKTLLFSNAADEKVRRRMTVRFGQKDKWQSEWVVHEGPAAYSSLSPVGKRDAGLLYERGDKRPYERITFTSFDWRVVSKKSDRNTARTPLRTQPH
jgi:sialidase-1